MLKVDCRSLEPAECLACCRQKYGISRSHQQAGLAFAGKWPVQAFDEQLALF